MGWSRAYTGDRAILSTGATAFKRILAQLAIIFEQLQTSSLICLTLWCSVSESEYTVAL